jgi:hypothetical protein
LNPLRKGAAEAANYLSSYLTAERPAALENKRLYREFGGHWSEVEFFPERTPVQRFYGQSVMSPEEHARFGHERTTERVWMSNHPCRGVFSQFARRVMLREPVAAESRRVVVDGLSLRCEVEAREAGVAYIVNDYVRARRARLRAFCELRGLDSLEKACRDLGSSFQYDMAEEIGRTRLPEGYVFTSVGALEAECNRVVRLDSEAGKWLKQQDIERQKRIAIAKELYGALTPEMVRVPEWTGDTRIALDGEASKERKPGASMTLLERARARLGMDACGRKLVVREDLTSNHVFVGRVETEKPEVAYER